MTAEPHPLLSLISIGRSPKEWIRFKKESSFASDNHQPDSVEWNRRYIGSTRESRSCDMDFIKSYRLRHRVAGLELWTTNHSSKWLVTDGDIGGKVGRPWQELQFGLEQRVDQPNHDQNDILDVVITRTDLSSQFIKATDVGLSDHRLVQWSLELETTTPVYETISRRAWTSFNIDALKSELQNSLLCDMSIITSPQHPDEMVKHYNDVITNLLNRLASIQQVTCRRRKSDIWFNNECHQFKQRTRRLERRYLANTATWWQGGLASGCSQHSSGFSCQERAILDCLDKQRNWKTTPAVVIHWPSVGNSRSSTSSGFTANDFMRFFQRNVADIRVSTEDAPSPTFAPSPGIQLNGFADIVVDDVIKLIRCTPSKQSSLDPLPSWLLLVQRINEEWSGTKSAEVSIYNATAQEAYSWQQLYQ